jgi:hypothetical protein
MPVGEKSWFLPSPRRGGAGGGVLLGSWLGIVFQIGLSYTG